MEIVPSINCTNIPCFRKKVAAAAAFLPKKSRVHVDIGRKPFTPKNSAVCLKTLRAFSNAYRFEGHLMSEWNPRTFAAYIRMPFYRLYLHQSLLSEHELQQAFDQAKKYHKELGFVFEAGVKPNAAMLKNLHGWHAKHVLLLAVRPGNSGQHFNPKALATARFLKKNTSGVTITIDGGVTPEVLRKARDAGADAAVSGSYIWDSAHPEKAYNVLRKL